MPSVQSDDDDDVMRTQGSLRPPSARDIHGGLQDQQSHGLGDMGSQWGCVILIPTTLGCLGQLQGKPFDASFTMICFSTYFEMSGSNGTKNLL